MVRGQQKKAHAEEREEDAEMEDVPQEGEGREEEEEGEDSDEEDEDEEEEENESALAELSAAVEREPFVYDHHIKYIAAARRTGQLEAVRGARERMNALFPLSPHLWLQWAEDEQRLAISPEDQQAVRKLFERGVKEYLSVPLWRSYTELMVKSWREGGRPLAKSQAGGATGAVTDSDVRGVCEEALTHLGLHPTAGHGVWSACRAFEAEVLSQMLSAGNAATPKARAGQVQRIRSLFVRQLAVPHASAARTAAQYAAWEGAVAGKEGEEAEATAAAAVGATGGEAGPTGGVPDGVPDAEVLSCLPKAVQVSFEKAVAAMGKRKDLEERIRGLQGRGEEDAGEAPQLDAEAQAGLSQAYHEYSQLEQTEGKDPARVQLLYERAVAALPVDSSLWDAYTTYVDKNLGKVPRVVCGVHARAVRNCPWVGSLWVKHLLAQERAGADEATMGQIFEQALAGGIQDPKETLEVFLTRADGLRRRLQAEAGSAYPQGGGRGGTGQRKGTAAEPSGEALDSAVVGSLRSTFERMRDWVDATEAASAEASAAEAAGAPPEGAALHFLDPDLRIPSYWSAVEADVIHDLPAARAVWEHALHGRGTEVEVWQKFVAFEVQRHELAKARALFKRGYSRRFSPDWGAQILCTDWLRFEREHGSLEDYDAALAKVSDRLVQLSALQAQAHAQAAAPPSADGTVKEVEGKRARKKAQKEAHQVAEGAGAAEGQGKKGGAGAGAGAKKRGREGAAGGGPEAGLAAQNETAQAAKRGRTSGGPEDAQRPTEGGTGTPLGAEAGGEPSGEGASAAEGAEAGGGTAPAGASVPAGGAGGAVGGSEGAAEGGSGSGEAPAEAPQAPRFTDERTVFVSGLPLKLKEEELRSMFGEAGLTPKAVRLVFDRQTKRFRGFAYVELERDEEVAVAEQRLNHKHVQGRRITVKKSDPSRGRGQPPPQQQQGGQGGQQQHQGGQGGHEGGPGQGEHEGGRGEGGTGREGRGGGPGGWGGGFRGGRGPRGGHQGGGHQGGRFPPPRQPPGVGHRRGGHLQLFGTPTFAMPRNLLAQQRPAPAQGQAQGQASGGGGRGAEQGAPANGSADVGGAAGGGNEKPVASNADFRALFSSKLAGPKE